MVELGCVDICLEVSMMSSHLVLPREGHLEQLYHIFAYLKKYHNSEMVFDPSDPVIDEDLFRWQDWTTSEFGLVTEEEVPENMHVAWVLLSVHLLMLTMQVTLSHISHALVSWFT